MNRRQLLKLLPTATVGAMISGETEKEKPHPDWGVYGDWFYRWSGWICIANQDLLVGRWVAKRPEDPFAWGVYSSYPGVAAKFCADQLFDTHIDAGQSIPNSETPTEKLEEFKNQSLERLIRYIEKHDTELRRPFP